MQATAAGERIELPSKVPYRKTKAGDRLVAYGPSGGGYGAPLQRAPAAVLDNVLDGLISVGAGARSNMASSSPTARSTKPRPRRCGRRCGSK